jgi:hypothetical protein
MIWVNIKSAGSSSVIEALQEWNQHEVGSVPELKGGNANLNYAKREQEKQKPAPLLRVGENAGSEQVNQKTSQTQINVGPRQVIDWRKKPPNYDIGYESGGAKQTNLTWGRSPPLDRNQA